MVLTDVTLGDEPDAVPRVRRLVVDELHGRPDDVADGCALVVTELVSNALLHGTAPIRVRTVELDDGVRVEVHDRSRRVPVLPQHSSDAMTGRGLALVAALSTSWGVEPSEDGKLVWAQVRAGSADEQPDPVDLDVLLADWPDDDEVRHTVRLGAVPTRLLLEAKSHIDNVVRELQLAGAERSHLPPAAEALVDAATRDFADARAEIKRQALAAAERGDPTLELELHLPASAADAGERYLAALEEADRYARAARLLTLETPPDHRVFRRWYLRALIDQLRVLSTGRRAPQPVTLLEAFAEHVRGLTYQQEAADRLRLLQKVTGELTGATTVEDIAGTVIGNAAQFLGALSGRVSLLDESARVLRTVPTDAGDQSRAQAYPEISLDADLPGSVVARTRQRLLLRNRHDIAERFPALANLYDSDRSLHVAPLVVGDHCLGVFALTFQPGSQFDEQEQAEFVTALAGALAQALERQLAMQQAAAANERLQFLADAAVVLSASLDYRDTVDAVAGLLVPRLADWCVIHILEGETLRMVCARHTDERKSAWAEEMSVRYGPKLDAPVGAPNVLRTGVSELYEEIPIELVRLSAHDEEHLRLIEGLGIRSGMTVPLTGRSGTFGAMTLIYAESGRRYTRDDLPFVEDVARRAALAVETATAFQEQSGRLATVSRVAEAAQRAILAPPAAQVGPAALAARYVSAAAEAQVGGDLYEVLERDGSVRLLIGDVRGKGLGAVRTATIVLGEFRAAAADIDDLGDVARQIDRRVRHYLTDEDFITALLVDVAEDGTLTVASCGHPPAVLRRRDGRISLLASDPTLPLGLGAAPQVLVEHLQQGDRLLLATDGLFEARSPDGTFVDVVDLVAPALGDDMATALDAVLTRLRATSGRQDLVDDLALLLAEFTGSRAGIMPLPREADAAARV